MQAVFKKKRTNDTNIPIWISKHEPKSTRMYLGNSPIMTIMSELTEQKLRCTAHVL